MFPAENKWFKELFSGLDALNALLRSKWLDASGRHVRGLVVNNRDAGEVEAQLVLVKEALDAVVEVVGESGYQNLDVLSKTRFEDVKASLFKSMRGINNALNYMHEAYSVLVHIDLEAAGVKDVDGLEKFLARCEEAYKIAQGLEWNLGMGSIIIAENFTGRVEVEKGKSVYVRITYDPNVRLEEQTTPSAVSILSFCKKNDRSLRDVIGMLNKRMFDSAAYAFRNPLFEPVFGEVFKKELNVYVVGQRKEAALVSKVKRIFRFGGKKIPVLVVPGGQLLRVFFNVESLLEESELEIGSALFHELIHLTDKKLDIGNVNVADRIRGEGLAIFSEALTRPRERVAGALKQCWIDKKVFYSLGTLGGVGIYQLGMLMCVELFLERIGKLREIRAIADREQSFEALMVLLETRSKEGELVVRAIRSLGTKKFFEFFFRKCGLPPFMGPQFGLSVGVALESEYISDKVIETWEKKSA